MKVCLSSEDLDETIAKRRGAINPKPFFLRLHSCERHLHNRQYEEKEGASVYGMFTLLHKHSC